MELLSTFKIFLTSSPSVKFTQPPHFCPVLTCSQDSQLLPCLLASTTNVSVTSAILPVTESCSFSKLLALSTNGESSEKKIYDTKPGT